VSESKRPTKAAIEQARREELGKCVAMTQDKEPKPCTHWASSRVGELAYCGTHAGTVLNQEIEAQRAAKKRAELDQRIGDYIAWRDAHPSVWDTRETA
jgi:hypothetical protein